MRISLTNETAAEQHRPEPAITHLSSHLRLWLVAGGVLLLDLWSKAWVFANLPAERAEPLIPGVIELRRSLNAGAVFGSLSGRVALFMVASVFALAFVVYLFAASSRKQVVLHVALGLVLAGALGNFYDRGQIKADVVTRTVDNGVEPPIIGEVIECADVAADRAGDHICVGNWPDPDPSTAHIFLRSEVTIRRQGVVRDFIKFVPKFPHWVPKLGGRDTWPWIFNIADAALVCGVGVLLCTSWSGRRTGEE